MRSFYQHGFTLLELLIVVAIMGLLGTVSVSGFRALRKGMEVRSTLQVVDEFVRAAYRRAVIDRTPVSIYFWNETVSDETSDASADKKLIVVGHAVAVRRAGRITQITGGFLIDEFGDLAEETSRDEEGDVDPNYDYQGDPGRYMYRVGDTTFNRSIVSTSSVERKNLTDVLMTQLPSDSVGASMKLYGYYLKDNGGISWQVGDAYGFEIAELTLPKNYIFGSGNDYSKSLDTPVTKVNSVIVIRGSGKMPGSQQIAVCGQKLDDKGTVAFKQIGKSADPTQER